MLKKAHLRRCPRMKQRFFILGSLVCYGASVGAEFLFLRHFLNADFVHLFPAFYFHVFSSLLFAGAAGLVFKFHLHLFSFFIASSFCFSAVALIGIPLFLGIHFLLRPADQALEKESESEEEMNLFLGILPSEKMAEDVLEGVHRKLEIEPYIDILKGGDDDLKKGALEQLAKIKNKEAIKLIQMALKDLNPEIRHTASINLKHTEDEFNEQILVIKEKLKKEQTKENHSLLGDTYSALCRSGLLDSVTQDYYYKLALNEYILSLQMDFKQPLILKNLAQNYFAIHRPDQALQILNRALSLHLEDPELYLLRCEAKAQLGEWEDISSDCKKIKAIKSWDSDDHLYLKELCEYWI